MKKLIVIFAIVAMAFAPTVLAANLKATLINASGDKVVVAVGSYEAQKYFGQDYVLMTNDTNLGAIPGADVFQRMKFHKGYERGGSYLSTTTAISAYTLLASTLAGDMYYMSWTPNLDITLTLPASSTMRNLLGMNPGATREYILYNASTTVASTITLAAGTGIDLQKNEDTANLATAGTSMTKITFIRKVGSDIMVAMEQYDVAD